MRALTPNKSGVNEAGGRYGVRGVRNAKDINFSNFSFVTHFISII
jgi:hypothetical protein